MKKQVYNPYLPINEYIPDGEPHVFGDRVYVYGSHDKEGGYTFCMQDYVVYSAPVNDLSDWRYEGVSYKASQDLIASKVMTVNIICSTAWAETTDTAVIQARSR